MTPCFLHAAAMLSAAFCCAGRAGGAGRGTPPMVNLHRVRVLLEGDARAVWIGDSWCRMSRTDRLPYGALSAWPFQSVSAVALGSKGGGGVGRAVNYTSGPGAVQDVNAANAWTVEVNGGEQAHFALPVNDMTKAFGDPGLVIESSGPGQDWVQAIGINNPRFVQTDSGPFSAPGDHIRCRMLYYAPADPADLLGSVSLSDWGLADRGTAWLRDQARPKWHLGGDPDHGPPAAATPSQINAAPFDCTLDQNLADGPELIVRQRAADPLVGSGDHWFLAGAVFYHTDESGQRVPGYYHAGLAQDSWSFAGHADDRASTGQKVFSDVQLRHWLDVTTLDRGQTPVVILHIATEPRTYENLESSVRGILGRYRAQFAAIGAPPPRFLLVGSYMHELRQYTLEQARAYIQTLDSLYADLAFGEPDCAFYSLYQATGGVFFTTDTYGGSGAQQAARDWLDANGWSSITYGGVTYSLSSADGGGLDGVLTADGLHLAAPPAAAFYAKLLGDAIAASSCGADFNGDGNADALDLLAFLNAWAAGEDRADADHNGVFDARDLLAFLNTWAAGC